MKYVLFSALLIGCVGCGTLNAPGAASMEGDISDSEAVRATSAPVSAEASAAADNKDAVFAQSGGSPSAPVARAEAGETFSADIPEAAFPDGVRQEVSLFPTEPNHGASASPAGEVRAECGMDCPVRVRWIDRSGFVDYVVPVLFELIDWGGGALLRALSGSKAKPSRSTRRSGGRSVREAEGTRSERKPDKRASRGQGRR